MGDRGGRSKNLKLFSLGFVPDQACVVVNQVCVIAPNAPRRSGFSQVLLLEDGLELKK